MSLQEAGMFAPEVVKREVSGCGLRNARCGIIGACSTYLLSSGWPYSNDERDVIEFYVIILSSFKHEVRLCGETSKLGPLSHETIETMTERGMQGPIPRPRPRPRP